MPSHEAADSALGYLYQIKYALVALLRVPPEYPDRYLKLESLDDVSFSEKGEPGELLQLKHHRETSQKLTDKSTELWKTIKSWLDTPQALVADGPILALISTRTARHDDAVHHLRPNSRNVAAALEKLDVAAQSSTNQSTEAARKAWLAVPPAVRSQLLERTKVFDGSPDISKLDQDLEKCLFRTYPTGKKEPYIALLSAWWDRVCLALLRGERDHVRASELNERLQTIRDDFTNDRLPTLVGPNDIGNEDVVHTVENDLLAHQLKWVGAGEVTLRKAAQDYHRAVRQATLWTENILISPEELSRFQDNLVDEWERAFGRIEEDLDPGSNESEIRRCGLMLYRSLNDSSTHVIREHYSEAFFGRGVRHELANSGQVGWHPNFRELMSQITGAASNA